MNTAHHSTFLKRFGVLLQNVCTRAIRTVSSVLFRLNRLPRVQTFELIYRRKLWGEHESVSGVGSTLQATRGVREALPVICKELSISTLVDIPCGDFSWMAELELPIHGYVGGDIVRELIESNRERCQADSRDFIVIDIVEDPLPKGDLILVRDCLVHLPNDDVEKCLQNIVSSNIRYLLATQYSCLEHNVPCRVGDWRPINLRRAPFNFPEPERLIPDVDFPGEPLRKGKQLALWDLNEIRGVAIEFQAGSTPKRSLSILPVAQCPTSPR